jgi:hypothetical protein
MKRLDITGQVFGLLTAIKDIGNDAEGRIWEFRCACGNTHTAHTKDVRSGEVKSCGCWRRIVGFELGKRNRGRHRPKISLRSRFTAHVDFNNRPMPSPCAGFGPCLIWTGSLDTSGRAIGRGKEIRFYCEARIARRMVSGTWILAEVSMPSLRQPRLCGSGSLVRRQ